MKLTIFQSGKGDCLLLTAQDGATLLVDGGMSNAYREHVRSTLGELTDSGRSLDLVYVSHIDEDHIAGILELMEDSVAWKRFDFQISTGNNRINEPDFPRPPTIKALWHNAFRALVEDNEGKIEDQLVANARITNAGLPFPSQLREQIAEKGDGYRNLATSVKQGLQLTRRAARQLNIPINPPTNGKLISVEEMPNNQAFGSMDIFVIGPFQKDLEKLRKDWNKWLSKNKEVVAEIEAELEEDPVTAVMDEGQKLASVVILLAAALGDRDAVTPPNLASLMLLAEENGNRLLLTGDGHADDISEGLRRHNKLDARGRLHVNALKVQHHGSKNNITKEFCERITANHYIYCGNGDHQNPHLEGIDLLVNAREGLPDNHPQAGKSFKLWFNSSAEVADTPKRKEHMQAVQEKVLSLAAKNELLEYEFLEQGSSFEIDLDR